MRTLNQNEEKLLVLMRVYETLLTSNYLTVELNFVADAIDLLQADGIRILDCVYSSSSDMFKVTMLKYEFTRYIDMCCKSVGFFPDIYGRIFSADGILISEPNDKW